AKDCIYGLINRNTMNGVRVGVYTDNTSVYISKNAINGLSSNTANALDVGIEYQNGDDRDIQIFDNTIVTWDSGIKVMNCLNPAVLSIGRFGVNFSNSIDILGSEEGYGAVDLRNCNNGIVRNTLVRNTLPTSEGKGFIVENCRGMSFESNGAANFPIGFGILGSPNNRFTDNAAYSIGVGTTPAAAFVNNTGFSVGGSPECFYCNNYTVDQDEDSWAFYGGCDMSNWSCNQLDDANRGLFLSADNGIKTVIGTQYLKGNDWFGTYANLGAFNGSSDQGRLFMSQFTTTPLETPSWSTGLGQFFWFVQFSGDTTVPCSEICGNTLGLGEPGGYFASGPGSNASYIANSEIDHEGISWILQQNLYERLHRNTVMMGTDADVIGFYQHADTTTIGDLHRVRAQLNTMLKGDLSILAFNDSLVGSLRMLSDSLLSLHDAGPGSDEQSWQNHIQRLGNQLTAGAALYYELQDSLHEGRLTDAAGIISANSTIVANTLPAANEKALNALYLSNQLWTGSETSPSVLAAIKSIADQCAYDGGYPVYWARGLYNGYVPSANWDDDILCGEEERPTSSEQQAVQAGKVQLIPNPADGYVLIVSKDAEAEAMLQITSANGAVVSDVPLPTGTSTQRVGTQQLSAGVYFYRLIAQGSQVQAGKLIIKH
ncbi:MAG: T9SS type A sorting domain-containing protein, partial [Saprospiraceae bacterium]